MGRNAVARVRTDENKNDRKRVGQLALETRILGPCKNIITISRDTCNDIV